MNVSLKLLQKMQDVIQPSKAEIPLKASSVLLSLCKEEFSVLDNTLTALHYRYRCHCINHCDINYIWMKLILTANSIQFERCIAQCLQGA